MRRLRYTLILLFVSSTAAVSVPEIVEHPLDNVVSRNEPVTLNCKVSGDPEPNVEWYKDGELVTTAREDPRSHKILLPDNGLFFLRALHSKKEKDSGQYWCKASNIGGTVTSRKGNLQVAYLEKEFRGLPSDVDVAVGSSVVLSCQAPKGNPSPSVSWKKDGKVYHVGAGSRLDGDSLVINAVSKKDAGSYQCRAENIATIRETPTVHLGVHEPPYFIKKPVPLKMAMVGGDILLECETGGDPLPKIRWTRQGASIDMNKIKVLDNKGIIIENVHPSDEGIYECHADNKIGRISTSVQVIVQERPVLTVSPEKSVQVKVGQEVRLSCLATGRPTPTVFWGKEGVQSVLFPGMKAGNVYVTADGSLKIKDPIVENSGRYTCSVVNDVGAAMARSHLLVYDPTELGPSRKISESHLNIYKTPTDSQVMEEARMALHQQIIEIDSLSSLSSSSIEVSWNTVGNRVFLEGLLLHYRPSSKRYEEFETITLRESRANSFVINNLEGSTEYDLFIQPFYSKIVGLPTSIKQISTEPEVIPGKTVILVAEMINMTTAFVVWQPYPSHLVTGYEVVLKSNESSISTRVDAKVSEVFLKLNANDLTQSYSVQIAAVSDAGKGEYSSPVKLSPPIGLPISVQPNLAEVESTAWLIVLLGSLAFMLLLLSSVMFYYRRKKEIEKTRGYLPAAVTDMDYQQKKNGLLWSDRQWNNSDSERDSTSSNKKLLHASPNSVTEYGYAPGNRIAYLSDRNNKQLFESPYATTDVMYPQHNRMKGSSTMHQLLVTPLLLQKSSESKRPFKRESHSFDNLNTSGSEIYAGVHKPPSFHRRSNPNILDLLPPPPVYAPPSLPKNSIYYTPTFVSSNRYYPPTNRSASGPQSHSAFNRRHIKIYDGCDIDRTLESISLGSQKECPNHQNHCNKKQTSEIEQALEQELTSFHETVTNFGDNYSCD